MWWDEASRQWKKHPDCTCDRDPCICRWLDPLDENGQPIRNSLAKQIRDERKRKEAAQPVTQGAA